MALARVAKVVVLQPRLCERPERVQQPEARLAVNGLLFAPGHVSFGERREDRQGIGNGDIADGRGGFLVPAINRHGESIEERLLMAVEQLVTPTNCSAERPMPLRPVS